MDRSVRITATTEDHHADHKSDDVSESLEEIFDIRFEAGPTADVLFELPSDEGQAVPQ